MSSYVKNTVVERTVYLTLGGTPIVGALPTDIDVSIKKAGEVSFAPFLTNSSNWIDLGMGYYSLIFSAVDMDVTGTFAYKGTGSVFDNLVFEQFNIIDPELAGATQSYFQDSPAERSVYLEKLGIPAASVLPNNIICNIKKAGPGGFNPNTLTTDNWINLGNGYYTIKFAATQMSNVGTFTYTLSGVDFDNFHYDEFVVVAKADITISEECIITGQIVNINNMASPLIKITARTVDFPAKFNGKIISADHVTAFLDYEGKFSLALIRGSTCIIEIPRAGIKHQINVPDSATADLMDLLPPFNIDYSF